MQPVCYTEKDPINWYLSSPPSGDLRISFYHVRKEFEDDFKDDGNLRLSILIFDVSKSEFRYFAIWNINSLFISETFNKSFSFFISKSP